VAEKERDHLLHIIKLWISKWIPWMNKPREESRRKPEKARCLLFDYFAPFSGRWIFLDLVPLLAKPFPSQKTYCSRFNSHYWTEPGGFIGPFYFKTFRGWRPGNFKGWFGLWNTLGFPKVPLSLGA